MGLSPSSWRFNRLGRERYQLTDRQILRRHNFWRDAIEVSNIAAWRVDYEMVFDCVSLTLHDGRQLLWLDYDSDLLTILRENLPQLQVAIS